MTKGPFTESQLELIEIADEVGSLLGHHHHHHDHDHGHGHDHHDPHQQSSHAQFKVPQKLNTSLGLYALKKLHSINPKILKIRQARLLDPVTPGPITYFINAGFYLTTGLYTLYLWRTRGLRGFATVAVLPVVALVLGRYLTNEAISYMRQGFYLGQRRKLVNDYSAKFGQQYMLSILNPAFRL